MRYFKLSLSIALLLLTIGCSGAGGKNFTQPPVDPAKGLHLGSGHSALEAMDLIIDADSGEIKTIQNRSLAIHINVTGFLNDPACPNSQCIYFILNNIDFETSEYFIDIFIMNPTMLSPWDPRVILLTSDVKDDFDVRNADSWITLFDDDPYPDNLNPFIAMAKEPGFNRRMPTFPFWDTEELVLWINPQKPDDVFLSYIVEVNWPGHAKEPYEINRDIINPNELVIKPPAPLLDDFSVSAYVLDWQDDMIEVSFYAPDILGDEWFPLDPPTTEPNLWGTTFTDVDLTNLDEGHYETWFRAMSDEPTDQVNQIYQRYFLPVFRFIPDGNDGTPGQGKPPRIVFLRETGGYSDIYVKELKLFGTEQNLTGNIPGWGATEEYRPAINRDGDKVVFASDFGGQIDLWEMPIDGGTPRRLTDTPWAEFGPRYNPDYPGNSAADWMDLVFYSYQNGMGDIFAMDILGPADLDVNVYQISFSFAEEVDPCIFPIKMGEFDPVLDYWVAFSANIAAWDNFDIFIIDPNKGAPPTMQVRITFDTSNQTRPTVTRYAVQNNLEIAYQTDHNGDYDIWLASFSRGYFPVVDRPGDQIDPSFSPDGKQIAFASDEEGDVFNLYTISSDGNPEFEFQRTANQKDEWSPFWGWHF